MEVYIEKTNKTVSVKVSTVKELLNKLKLNPTTVLVVKNNEIVLDDEKLTNADSVRILSVISGG